ncbi:MAG: phosphotransferase [Nitriliruptoraceae bacterium]
MSELTSEDAAGGHREPVVLSPAQERSVLSAAAAAAGVRLVTSRIRSIHHRPGRSRSVLHDATIEVAGQRHEVVLVTHVETRGFPDGAFVLSTDELEVAVWRFPNDPYLPGLPSAVSAERVRELLDELGAVPGRVHLRTRAYRPVRRAVVEVQVDGRRSGRVLYFKILPQGRARSVARRHRQLTAAGLPVPGVIGVAKQQGIVAIEALAGPTLAEALRAGGRVPRPEQLLAVTEDFAGSGVAGSRDPRRFADPVRHVPLLAGILPEREAEITSLAREAAAVEAPLVGVHGDLHAGQLLLGADGAITGVLDVDGAGQGYRVHDAGNLVAHLEAFGDLHPAITGRVHAYAREVAEAYAEVCGPQALARAMAGSWIGLATGAYRAREPGWQLELERRIDRAAALLSTV